MYYSSDIPQYRGIYEMDERQIRGFSILAKGDSPQKLDREEYSIPSQSGNGRYKVIHKQDWSCECPDFRFRNVICKHIHAVRFWLKVRNKVEVDDLDGTEDLLNENRCPFCNSLNVKKAGFRKNKSGNRQKWECKDCKKYFVADPIKYVKGNGKIVTLTMDLYFKGLSLRDISDTIYQFYGLRLHHETVRRWISKFTKIMNDYVNEIEPTLSGKYQIDEQMVKSKGKWIWSWNAIDEKTRFLIANNITKNREVKDARQIFKKIKEVSKATPSQIKTDGLQSYNKAMRKEFVTHRRSKELIKHIRNVGVNKESNNNLIERYHNEFREFDKVRRGFKSDSTTQEWNEGFRLYHNFIKQHMSLDGFTPSQVAEIELGLGRNRWLTLLRKSIASECEK